MVLFLTTLLLISCVGMAAIVAVKERELRTGQVFFAGARPRLRRMFARALSIERSLPRLAREVSVHAGAAARAGLRALVARGAVLVESLLERLLHVLRYKTSAPAAEGEASPFLREVAEYKKKLQEERPE